MSCWLIRFAPAATQGAARQRPAHCGILTGRLARGRKSHCQVQNENCKLGTLDVGGGAVRLRRAGAARERDPVGLAIVVAQGDSQGVTDVVRLG